MSVTKKQLKDSPEEKLKKGTNLDADGASVGSAPAASAGSAPAASKGFTYDDFSYDDFSYNDYAQSDTVKQAYNALQSHLAAKPGEYQSTWQGQINGMIDRILNREKFSYDVNEDALYQQMKDQYTALGKIASQDVMGQAAAMTGGYGNSYASSAGNQAYQAYLRQLNEAVPELYGMARDQYNQEGQEMYNQYGLLSEQENQDYGRWVDGYNQWASERDYLQGDYKDERSFDYGKYSDERNFAYGKYADDRNFAYGAYADDKNYAYTDYRNAIADQQWQTQFDESVRQYNEGMEYQKGRDAVYDTRYDTEWAYQQDRDKISDTRYDTEWAYQQDRDKISDKRYDESWAYQQERDKVADTRYDSEWAYQQERDKVSDTRYDESWAHQLERESVEDARYDDSWAYQQERDKVADTRYDSEWAYQQERDKISDTRYDESWAHQLEREGVEDSRYDEQWQHQLDREAVDDERYDKEWKHQSEREFVEDSQWNQTQQLNINADKRAQEAWEMEKTAYEEAKASGGSGDGSGSNQAALEHVSSMSSAEIVDTMKAYNYDEDNTGLAAFLDDCVASGRLTEEQADEYYKKYRTGSANDVYDTTVNPTYMGSIGGGRPGGLLGPNVAIK